MEMIKDEKVNDAYIHDKYNLYEMNLAAKLASIVQI